MNTCGILNNFSRLATWIEVTLDGAPTTPAMRSGWWPSLQFALFPANLDTEPEIAEGRRD